MSPAPHLDALTCHLAQRHWLGACTRQPPPPLDRVTVSIRKHTHVYRPKVCPDPIRPAPSTLSVVFQPGQSVSRPAWQSKSAGRVPSDDHNIEYVGRIDRLLSTTSGQISVPSPSLKAVISTTTWPDCPSKAAPPLLHGTGGLHVLPAALGCQEASPRPRLRATGRRHEGRSCPTGLIP